jgi:SAM-dependent methyltransferase
MTPVSKERPAAAKSFGFQWAARAEGRFEETTLYGLTADQERETFFRSFGIRPEDLKGKLLLDAGCGDGLLLQLISGLGAEIVGVDVHTAITVPYRRCRDLPDVTILQADLLKPCFAPGSFDFVWCEGVIVAMPDPREAFFSVSRLVKPGGRLYMWVYPSERPGAYQRLRDLMIAPYLLPYPLLYGLCQLLACGLYPLYHLKGKGRSLRTLRFDLFDNLSPRYQWRFKEEEFRALFEEAGFTDLRRTGRIGMSGIRR